MSHSHISNPARGARVLPQLIEGNAHFRPARFGSKWAAWSSLGTGDTDWAGPKRASKERAQRDCDELNAL